MSGVAAPLYRFFLADARTAARAGDAHRAMECLEMALDFAPDSQRERVLLVAAEIVPSGGAAVPGNAVGLPAVTSAPFMIAIEDGGEPARRISWEDRVVAEAPAPLVFNRPIVVPVVQPPRAARRGPAAAVALVVIAGLSLLAFRAGVVPVGVVEAFGIDQVEAARRAAASGQPGEALRLLDGMGADAPSSAWLVRAHALELSADTAGAVRALAAAASADAGGGADAMRAGDELVRLRAVAAAADAYLYAVAPQRTPAELERIAQAQDLAGHADRARRVRSGT